jgi:hypothetical protein
MIMVTLLAIVVGIKIKLKIKYDGEYTAKTIVS